MRWIFLLIALAACAPDETLHAYGAGGRSFALQSIDGSAFGAAATLAFPEPGRIAGRAPCNAYSGTQSAPYPWFVPGPLVVTRMGCPDLAEETRYLQALSEMSLAEVSGDTLILSDETGREMVFIAQPGG